ncbi:hypothetical protein [Sphingomonas sp. UNC305MFCol5.2]|nr:hypothetical protein [Sphingomonas sp. UNC305MFCol5.2]
MTQDLRMVPGRIAGFGARQPRIAIGGLGLASVVLIELALMLASHTPA